MSKIIFLFIHSFIHSFIHLFILLHWVLVLQHTGSSLWHAGFSLVVAHGIQSVQAQQLWHVGSPVVVRGLQSVRDQLPRGMWDLSSLTRDRICILYIGRWILNHWTTREVPKIILTNKMLHERENEWRIPTSNHESNRDGNCPPAGKNETTVQLFSRHWIPGNEK